MDAGLAASMGIYLALEQKQWSLARERANQYLSHPEAEQNQKDPHYWTAFSHEILAGILCDDIEASIAKCITAIDANQFGRWNDTFVRQALGNLQGALIGPEQEQSLDPRLRQYASDLFARLPNSKANSKKALLLQTNQQMIELTYSEFKKHSDRIEKARQKRIAAASQK